MKFGIRLSIFALLCNGLAEEDYLGFFGDGEVLSSGIQFLGRSPDSQLGEIQTSTPYELNTWDALTGELIRTAQTQFQEEINSGSYLDWEDTNTIAYTDDLETLVLIRRDTSEIIETHTFEGQIITEIKPVSDSHLLSVSTQSIPPDPQSFPSYFQITNASHLIDTGNGIILRSLENRTRNQTSFHAINGVNSILALTRGTSRHATALNGSSDLSFSTQSLSQIHILDTNSGSDLISPIKSNGPPGFSGTGLLDEAESVLYAILERETLHRIDLKNFAVDEFQIEAVDGVASLFRSGDTLGALAIKADAFLQTTSIVFWNLDDFTLSSEIDQLHSATDPAIHSFLPVPGKNQLILASRSGEIELWEKSPPNYIRSIGNAQSDLLYWALSPDEEKLFTGSIKEESNLLHVWDLQNGGLLVENSNPRNSHVGLAAYFSDDSQRIYWYDSNSKLIAHRLTDGLIDFSIPPSPNSAIACGYFNNGSKRMLVHSEGTVQIFDEEDSLSTFDLNADNVHPLQIDPINGLFLYEAGTSLNTYDPTTNTIKTLLDTSETGAPSQALLNHEATRLLLLWNDPNIVDIPPFLGFPGTSTLSTFQLVNLQKPEEFLVQNILPANGIALSPDGTQYVISLTEPPSINFYDTMNGTPLLQQQWTSRIDAITYASDGKSLFILSSNEIHSLDVATGEILSSHPSVSIPISPLVNLDRITTSPDGKMLAVFGTASLILFQLPDFLEIDFLFKLPVIFTRETQFSFSPNGRSFLLIDFLSNANEWHLRNGTPADNSQSNFSRSYPMLSISRKSESIYSFQKSTNLIDWRYSALKSNPQNKLENFPLYPISGSSIFGRIIEFKKPD